MDGGGDQRAGNSCSVNKIYLFCKAIRLRTNALLSTVNREEIIPELFSNIGCSRHL